MGYCEERRYMLWKGCILEEVAVVGPSSVLPSAVDHLQRDRSDHTGRMAVP